MLFSPQEYQAALAAHYAGVWGRSGIPRRLGRGPEHELGPGFCALEFAPTTGRGYWAYGTAGMRGSEDQDAVELHMVTAQQCDEPVELLTVVAHYHRTAARLDVGHLVNFGVPWLPGSACRYGLVSLPYLSGPQLERLEVNGVLVARCLWLLPITERERDFAKRRGLEALERRFEAAGLDYLDPFRPSAV